MEELAEYQRQEESRIKGNAPDATRSKDKAEGPAGSKEKVITGRLQDHGEAAFQFVQGNSASYFARIDTEAGPRTLWGVDLKRAIEESGAKKDDAIRLKYMGSQPVKVKETIKGSDGRPVRERGIETHRNVWHAEKTEEQREREAALMAATGLIVNERVKKPEMRAAVLGGIAERVDERSRAGLPLPSVQVYDRKAAPQGRQAEAGAERGVQGQGKERDRGVER